MDNFIILGALVLAALVAFKLFGKLLKMAILVAVAAFALLYFYGGHNIGGVTLPSLNL